MSWNVTGLTNHQKVEWKTSDPSQSVEKFTKTAGKRPDTLFKLKAGKVEIRTGARVTRHHGNWSRFKSRLSGLLHTITPKGMFKAAKANRAHRHAEFNRDKAVNKLVENIANGKTDPKSLSKQLVNISRLNQRLAAAHPTARPNPGQNQPPNYSKNEIRDIVDQQFETTLRESIQTALRANPDAERKTVTNLKRAFESLSLSPNERANGNVTMDDMRRDETASVGLKVVDEEYYDFKTSARGVREVMQHKDPEQITNPQAHALVKFASEALQPGGAPSEEHAFALKFLQDTIKSAPVGSGGDPVAQDFLEKLDSKQLNMLGKAVRGAINSSTRSSEPTKVLYEAIKSNLAEDFDGFMEHVQPEGKTDGLREAWVNDVIGLACTAKKENGSPLHSDAKLNSHFDKIYKEELPKQTSKSSYFRRNEASVGFISGLLTRYGEGKLEELGATVGQSIAERLKTAGDPPSPKIVGAAIRESIQTIASGSGDVANPKLDAFLQKVHKDFKDAGDNGNDVIKGEANKFTRTVALLRNVTPEATPAALKAGLSKKHQNVANSNIVGMVQSIANGTSLAAVKKKAERYAKSYVEKTDNQIDAEMAQTLKKAKAGGASEDDLKAVRTQANLAKTVAREESQAFVDDIVALYKQQFAAGKAGGNEPLEEPKPFMPNSGLEIGPDDGADFDEDGNEIKRDIVKLETPGGQDYEPQLLDDEEVLSEFGQTPAIDKDDTKEDIDGDIYARRMQAGAQTGKISEFFRNMVDIDLDIEPNMKLPKPKDLFEQEVAAPVFRFDDVSSTPVSRSNSDVDIDYADRLR